MNLQEADDNAGAPPLGPRMTKCLPSGIWHHSNKGWYGPAEARLLGRAAPAWPPKVCDFQTFCLARPSSLFSVLSVATLTSDVHLVISPAIGHKKVKAETSLEGANRRQSYCPGLISSLGKAWCWNSPGGTLSSPTPVSMGTGEAQHWRRGGGVPNLENTRWWAARRRKEEAFRGHSGPSVTSGLYIPFLHGSVGHASWERGSVTRAAQPSCCPRLPLIHRGQMQAQAGRPRPPWDLCVGGTQSPQAPDGSGDIFAVSVWRML